MDGELRDRSNRSDPNVALRYATKRARKWFQTRGETHIAGMDADDIAQEVMLAMLRSGADLRYSWNKTKFILKDGLRKHSGFRWKVKKTTNYQGSEMIEVINPACHRTSDEEEVIRQAIELVEYSDLHPIAKTMAVMRLRGIDLKDIAAHLGIEPCMMSYYKIRFAQDLHRLAGIKCPPELMKKPYKPKPSRAKRFNPAESQTSSSPEGHSH